MLHKPPSDTMNLDNSEFLRYLQIEFGVTKISKNEDMKKDQEDMLKVLYELYLLNLQVQDYGKGFKSPVLESSDETRRFIPDKSVTECNTIMKDFPTTLSDSYNASVNFAKELISIRRSGDDSEKREANSLLPAMQQSLKATREIATELKHEKIDPEKLTPKIDALRINSNTLRKSKLNHSGSTAGKCFAASCMVLGASFMVLGSILMVAGLATFPLGAGLIAGGAAALGGGTACFLASSNLYKLSAATPNKSANQELDKATASLGKTLYICDKALGNNATIAAARSPSRIMDP